MSHHPLLRTVGFPVLSLSLALGVACQASAAEKRAAYQPAIDPANFTAEVGNPYFTLTPGTTFTYQGKDEKGVEVNKVTVTGETRKVMGVTTRVVWDRVWLNGKLVEETHDWYARDKEGNVWYFGEDTRGVGTNGKTASAAGSWEAGVKGAQPGIVMPAHPQPGEPYRQEYLKGEAEDMGQVLSTKESVKTPHGSFANCVETKDWSAIEKDSVEHKYYAKEVGFEVLTLENSDKKRMELVAVAKEGTEEKK